MQKFEQAVNQGIAYIIAGTIFFIPLFFLPFTRDFVIYTKLYFLAFVFLSLIVMSFIKLLFAKRFFWTKNPFIQVLFLVLFSLALSILLRSPNKIQAFFNPQFGFMLMMMLVGYYVYATEAFHSMKKIQPAFLLTMSGFVVSLISLVFLINPFKNVQVSPMFAFVKNPYFNTVGNQFELIAFLVFTLTAGAMYIFHSRKHRNNDNNGMNIMYMLFLGVIGLGIVFQVFTVGKALFTDAGKIVLPPLSLSWYAAIETLKNPLTALFGVGVDNFASIFTRVRDINYNMSSLWQFTSFSSSRSTLLHILTETGLLGLISFCLLLGRIYQHKGKMQMDTLALTIVSVFFLVIFPPSLILFFMFFTSLALVSSDIRQKDAHDTYEVDTAQTIPLYIGLITLYVLFLGASTYFIGRHLLSEIYFKKSIDAVAANDLKGLYENQRQAILLNQYNEDFRINFSQTNLLVANNLAGKKKEEITDADRQTIAQAIQASIQEAKAAAALNPEKVTNWQNLAAVYKNIINVAKDAELWTVSAYQQAIQLDPQNPNHRLELGGVFYLFGNYAESQKMFEQAVALKPDWSNAHYNLAWSYAQQKDYQKAVGEMQNVLALLNPKQAESDYKKAQKDLEEFKKNLPKEESQTEGQTPEQATEKLNLPSPPAATVEPKIELDKSASPQATEGATIGQ